MRRAEDLFAPDAFDKGLIAARERNLLKPQDRTAPFKMCRRARYVGVDKLVPWDEMGHCVTCGVEIWFDSRESSKQPKLCVPCVVTFQERGLVSIDALQGHIPGYDDINDDQLIARLAANVNDNEKHGMVDPKNVRGAPSSAPPPTTPVNQFHRQDRRTHGTQSRRPS